MARSPPERSSWIGAFRARLSGDGSGTPSPHSVPALVRRLKHGSLTIAVESPSGVSDPFPSALLALDADAGTFDVDEINHPSAGSWVAPGTTLRVEGRVEGSIIRFRSKVSAIVQRTERERRFCSYRMRLPVEVDYVQRRAHYRIAPPAGVLIPVHLPGEQGHALDAELCELSLSGFSARVSGAPAGAFQPGRLLTRCALTAPDGERIAFDAHVRRARPSGDTVVIGCQFYDLSRATRRRLQQLTASLERDSARRRSTD
jgi:c-di-GMP-binding flagellar brake protein YcgR